MLLKPQQHKFNKWHKGKIGLKSINFFNNELNCGYYGLKSMESGRITSNHLETFRKALRKIIKRTGKTWIKLFPHIPVSAKPSETRMGKGKGKISYFTSFVRSGTVIAEIKGVNSRLARKAFQFACKKLPVKSKFIYRKQYHDFN